MLPSALEIGMTVDEFWENTLGETIMRFKAYAAIKQREADEKSLALYTQAKLIAEFVGLAFNGKRIPSYDNVFKKTAQTASLKPIDKKQEAMKVSAYLLEYARRHNEQRHRRLESAGEVK